MTKIFEHGRVILLLNDGRIRTLPGVLPIPGLAQNLIFVSKIENAGVQRIVDEDTCNMVRGAMVLMRGVWIGTLYKLLGSTLTRECNSSIVSHKGKMNVPLPTKITMLWHRWMGHIEEKNL